MKVFIIIFLLLFSLNSISGQADNKGEYIIEGGKVMVDLIKVLKPSSGNGKKEASDCMDGELTSLCFENLGETTLSVSLNPSSKKNKEGAFQLVIPKLGKECKFSIKPGIYNYEILLVENKQIIRKGEIIVDPCEESLRVIKQKK